MKAMKSAYFFILQFVFLCCNLVHAQDPQDKWILNSPASGNKTYIARDSIILKPNFTYTATSDNTFTAKIDQTLLFPPTENTYADANGNIVNSSSQGAVVGNLSGAFDVSPTGAATYTVPIEVPPGIQGMQPNISLVYNSQSGNGIAGMCWNIGGLSMISRVQKDYYFDNERSGIIWNNTSPLALDGQRLIIVNNSWGNDSIEYRTESGLDRIVGYNIKSWGPLTFKVYTKDGKILEYGDKASISSYFTIRLKNANNIETADSVYNLCWALAKITDANNNNIEFAYESDLTTYSPTYYEYEDARISSISYGNQTGTTKEIVGSVNFAYKIRSNPSISYIDGLKMFNLHLLDTIQTKGVGGSLLDTYQLTYSTLDQKNFLTQIKRTSASGESIQPIKFDWNPMSYSYNYYNSLTFIPTPNFSSYVNFAPYSYGDIDGDGLVDLLVRTSTSITGGTNTWIVYRNLGNNTFQKMYEENWDRDNEKTFLFLDLDNDGKDELYVGRAKQSGTTYTYYLNCYKYATNSFKADASGDKSVTITKSVYDKRNSLYALSGDFLGNGTSQFIIFSSNNTPESKIGLNNTTFPFGNSSKSKIFLTDLNGNGKPEIAFVNDGTTSFYEYQGNSFVNILTTNQFKYTDYIQVGDFNGDGNSDLLVLNRYPPQKWKVFTSNGRSFAEKDVSNYISIDVSYYKALVVDVNGDGKSDILTETPNWVNGAASTNTLRVISSIGNSFTTYVLNTQANITSGSFQMASQFKTGHSKDAFILFNKSPQIISLSPNVWFNKINKITDSYGKQLTISYTDHKNPYPDYQNISDTYDGSQSVLNFSLPNVAVVGSITATNVNQSYVYANPQIDRQSKGFLGFSSIQTIDNIRSVATVNENRYNSAYHFLYPYKDTIKTTSGTLISEAYQTYTISSPGTKRYFLKQDSLVSTDALKGITVKTAYSNYDTDRNPQTINTDYGSGISTTQALTYVSRGSLFLNKISSSQTTQKATGQQDVVRKEYFLYDNKGNPTYHVADSTDVNDINKVQTFYSGYDQYGNPGKITTTANGVSRSKSMTYCSSGRFLKTETDNQFNETTTYYYDESHGLLTSQIDRLGTTSYQYDSFGRLKLTTFPDGIKTADALQWAGAGKPNNAIYYTYTETSGQSPVWVWYDGLGREIRRDSYGLNNKKIMIDTKYYTSGASMGQIYQVSDPYFENTTPPYATTYTYDSYGRISSMLTPMGTTTYGYNKLTDSIISPEGIRKTTINSAGWTTEEETNGKKVNFTHYPSGLIKTATPQDGQAIAMEYDLQGNRTKLTDPDAGVITSKYDGWGQLIQEEQKIHVDANPIVTTYNYLPSGLLNYKQRNGMTTNYGYDNLYRLKWVSIAGKHSQGLSYDQYDRIIQTNDTVEGTKIFISKTEYDPLGNVYKETYPSGYYITNQYDKYGYLTGVTDGNGSNIWQALESNAKEQLTRTQSGGKETTFGFDSRGFPTSIYTSGIFSQTYSFNLNGNLEYRTDTIGATAHKETYSYDGLNRLTGWTTYKNGIFQCALNNAYNPITGNLQYGGTIGAYTLNYGEINGKPHALTSIVGNPPNIDPDQSISYTDFSKVKNIQNADYSLSFLYGTDEQRIKTVLTGLSGTLTRYYMGNYEEENRNGSIRKIHYVNGGNGLAAIFVQNNGNDTLYFAQTDYQGSLAVLSLNNGSIQERYAYDPWGNRRNPNDWLSRDWRTSFLFNRGYTLHEHLKEFGLINMNGRMYDPITMMFFSPDSYLQSPEDWLNFNRYSYCLNNPLKYTDPSGEFLGLFFRAMVFVDDALSNWINGYNNPIGTAWKTSGDATNKMSSCMQFPIVNNDNMRITAGLDPFSVGVSANITYKTGKTTLSGNFGFGFLGGWNGSGGISYSTADWDVGGSIGAGDNYWGWNASVTKNGVGAGYGQTHYGNDIGPNDLPNPQTVGNYSVYWRGGSFTLQNDVGKLGDSHDRWRTNAFELSIGDFTFGNYIYTNDGQKVSESNSKTKEDAIDTEARSPIFGKNPHSGLGAWKIGKVYSAPAWIGIRSGNQIDRIGYSLPFFQDLFQNGIHTTFGNQNYYLNYRDFQRGLYIYSGYYNPFTLYGH